MAHFAVVNSENNVLEVIVISNDEILDENGNESEALGRAKCAEIRMGDDHLGTQYIQCSRTNRIRGRYAAPGFVYDPESDVFHPKKPPGEWVLNSSYAWEKPGKPEQTQQLTNDGLFYRWEEGSGWVIDMGADPPALPEGEEETHFYWWDRSLYEGGNSAAGSWVKLEILTEETPVEETE